MIKSLTFKIGLQTYGVDLGNPIDISIPLREGDQNPNCYWAGPVKYETINFEDFIGDVSKGGSCNYKRAMIIPHGNGTHTECYGHISPERSATINRCLKDFLFLAQLVTIRPQKISTKDEVIKLEDIIKVFKDTGQQALIIRTLPNGEEKMLRRYSGANPPYFLPEVMDFLVGKNIEHLLVDLPSIDKEEDEGKLEAHHRYWRYPEAIRKKCTLTELIYVGNETEDGLYFLNLQVTSMELDASPSKPIIYDIFKV